MYRTLVQQNLPKRNKWCQEDIHKIAEMTENFTGDDIRVAFKEATMIVIRNKIKEKKEDSGNIIIILGF